MVLVHYIGGLDEEDEWIPRDSPRLREDKMAERRIMQARIPPPIPPPLPTVASTRVPTVHSLPPPLPCPPRIPPPIPQKRKEKKAEGTHACAPNNPRGGACAGAASGAARAARGGQDPRQTSADAGADARTQPKRAPMPDLHSSPLEAGGARPGCARRVTREARAGAGADGDVCGAEAARPPPPSFVLSGHAASLTPY